MKWRRKKSDQVTPEVHHMVLARDECCIAARMSRLHECRDAWGTPHSPWDQTKLTLDHVWVEFVGGVKGKRAPSDPQHLVALCFAANVGVPSKELREYERRWLIGIYSPQHYGIATAE